MGAPKKRLMWLDIGDPNTPVLVWQEGDILDRARVKDKDRMSLIDIIDIKAGQVSAPLRRSGRAQHAEKYLSFTAEDRTFDVEAPTIEGRDWLFKKFADLFQVRERPGPPPPAPPYGVLFRPPSPFQLSPPPTCIPSRRPTPRPRLRAARATRPRCASASSWTLLPAPAQAAMAARRAAAPLSSAAAAARGMPAAMTT